MTRSDQQPAPAPESGPGPAWADRRRASAMVMAVTVGALVTVILTAVLGLVAMEGRERAIADREDAHRQLIEAQGDLNSGFASTAVLLAGPPGAPVPGFPPPTGGQPGREGSSSGPPAAAVPPPPPQLIGAVEQVRQVLEQLEASARRLADLAVTDPVTGLANQRELKLQLDAEVSRARRYERPLSLILLDLDHFKLVNDEFGHQKGDEVLTGTAARLAALARTGGTMARIGGEEFAWIVPEAEQLDAYLAAERARRAIRRMPFGDVAWLTISCGVCDLSDAEDAAEPIRHADSALYWAKDQGRDATFCFSPGAAQDLAERARAGGRERSQALGALRSLAQAIDSRHVGTRDHSRRVARVAEAVATELGWTPRDLARLRDAALVHDVGMVQVPDDVLLKSRDLDGPEQSMLKEHVALGTSMVAEILDDEQAAWVKDHHERWDGNGYPRGLAAEEISAGGRIPAVADAWDAITRHRPHRGAGSAERALDELRGLSGTQFCPTSVAALERASLASSLPSLDADEVITIE